MSISRLVQLPERIWKKFHSQGLILLYHRVVTLDTDPQLLSVTPKHFAAHLEFLSERYNPISLSELRNALEVGEIPDKSVVITFDDGYADNLWNAKPLLEKYGIPATVFVTSGYVGSKREFWFDELERIVLLTDQLPEHLEITINGKILSWNLTERKNKMPWGRGQKTSKPWDVTIKSDPAPKYTLYREFHQLLKPMTHEQQESVLSTLAEWAGVSRTERDTHMPLTVDELHQLDRGELIEIGSHTVTHALLSAQPMDTQKREIVQSKNLLEDLLGHPIQSFSYPYGGRGMFTGKTVEMVKEAGITTACANYGSTLIRSADPYRLPRVLVRNWDIGVFSSRMKDWFNE